MQTNMYAALAKVVLDEEDLIWRQRKILQALSPVMVRTKTDRQIYEKVVSDQGMALFYKQALQRMYALLKLQFEEAAAKKFVGFIHSNMASQLEHAMRLSALEMIFAEVAPDRKVSPLSKLSNTTDPYCVFAMRLLDEENFSTIWLRHLKRMEKRYCDDPVRGGAVRVMMLPAELTMRYFDFISVLVGAFREIFTAIEIEKVSRQTDIWNEKAYIRLFVEFDTELRDVQREMVNYFRTLNES